MLLLLGTRRGGAKGRPRLAPGGLGLQGLVAAEVRPSTWAALEWDPAT